MWCLFFRFDSLAGNSRVLSCLSCFLAVGTLKHNVVMWQTGKMCIHLPQVRACGNGAMATSNTAHMEITGAGF